MLTDPATIDRHQQVVHENDKAAYLCWITLQEANLFIQLDIVWAEFVNLILKQRQLLLLAQRLLEETGKQTLMHPDKHGDRKTSVTETEIFDAETKIHLHAFDILAC